MSAPPTHSVYRIVRGEYEDTPCWCAATHDHIIGHEQSDTGGLLDHRVQEHAKRPRRWNDTDDEQVWADRMAYIRSRALSPQPSEPESE